jgi:multiple sugar transport system permease protein
MNTRRLVGRGLTYFLLTVSTLILIYPILYMALAAFTTSARLKQTILLPIPNTLNWGLIVSTWNGGLWQTYVFTLGRCLFYVFFALLTGLFGGFVLSKLRFRGRHLVNLLFISGLVMPSILLIVPNFIMMAWFPLLGGNNWLGQGGHGLINDPRVLFAFGWVSPLAIFLLKQNFDMLPTEYMEAARIDGAGVLTIIFRVYAPLLKPALATIIMLTFLTMWNDFLWPSLVLTPQMTATPFLPITLRFAGVVSSNFGGAGSASPAGFMRIFLVLWPPALVYLIFQRYFVQGLVATGLHG